MAEQIAQDVVKDAKSMGNSLPIDDTAKPTNTTSAFDGTKTLNESLPQTVPLPSEFAKDADGSRHKGTTENEATIVVKNEAPNSISTFNEQDHVHVNGITTDTSAGEDAGQVAVADGSGGSDTDNSKDHAKDQASGHTRTNSIKKPTFFKSSAVTKTFLAKTAAVTPPTPGNKATVMPGQAGTAGSQTTKPRLVAKSGSGLGNIPRSGLAQTNGNGGPDASKVWNKNRPVPPPPPKQFTDEELKQQYGIHMATRLQADDSSKDQSKWADIDDDEDDWAPETVEWMDGTKSTVAAAEENAAPKEVPRTTAPPVQPIKPAEPAQSKPPVAASPTLNNATTGGTKTILKPGVLAQNNQARQGGLVLKGAPEKPALTTKSPAPTPAKSPWATLPPIDKASPVHINPPPPQPSMTQSRFGQRDPHGFDALPPVSSPAKEIAADDFSRSWREERGNRELFNSQSGRYEPVNDARRGSLRDSSHRQPAVLQRPPPGVGPAEPSPAFQTSRTGSEAASWGRRRNSSNVSAGSGGRRMSFSRAQDGIPPDSHFRRDSHSVAGSEAPIPEGPPRPGFGPHRQSVVTNDSAPLNHQKIPQYESPVSSHAQPLSPFESVPSTVNNDVQNQASAASDPAAIDQMRKQILARARLAKQAEAEEEAKKEAAKKERLAKLMAGIPESKPKQPADALQTPADSSPPKPPAPTADGKVQQYGMMKVHAAQADKKSPPATSTTLHADRNNQQHNEQRPGFPRAQAPTQSNRVSPLHGLETQQATTKPHAEASADTGAPGEIPGLRASTNKHEPTPQAAWKGAAQSDKYQPAWTGGMSSINSQPAPAPANVWGPPASRERALGNGTFDSNFNRVPPATRVAPQSATQVQGQGPSSTPPGPIAPPSKASPASSQQLATGHTPPSHVEQHRTFGNQHDMRPTPTGTVVAMPPVHHKAQVNLPDPIAPPSKATANTPAPSTRSTVSDWTALSKNPRKHDAEIVARREEAFRVSRANNPNVTHQIEETYKRTAPGSKLGERQVVAMERFVHDRTSGVSSQIEHSQGSVVNQHGAIGPPSGGHATSMQPGSQLPQQLAQAPSGTRSRFFPIQQARPGNPAWNTPGPAHADVLDSDSPPPPETYTTNHPAFDGDVSQPKVHLPTPKAVVKLPPAPTSPQASVVMPARPQAVSRMGSLPIVQQTAWQARFNGLLRPHAGAHISTSPPSTPAAVIAASSKAQFSVPIQQSSATVSLPSQQSDISRRSLFSTDNSKDCVSKTTAEEELLAEQEFGSLPRVHLSRCGYRNMNASGFPLRPRHHMQNPSRVAATTIESIIFEVLREQHSGGIIRISIPGDKRGAITKPLPRDNHRRSSGHHGKPKRNNGGKGEGRPHPAKKDSNSGSNTPTSSRPAKPPGSFHNQSESRPTRTTSSRGNWNNNGSNANNNRSHHSASNTWGKRATPAAVH